MATRLDQIYRQRVLFDVNNKKHIDQYAKFLRDSKWEAPGCPFSLEYPWMSIPDMIKDKLVRKFLKV